MFSVFFTVNSKKEAAWHPKQNTTYLGMLADCMFKLVLSEPPFWVQPYMGGGKRSIGAPNAIIAHPPQQDSSQTQLALTQCDNVIDYVPSCGGGT